MKDQELKEMFDRLKTQYDQMPTRTSPERIMSQLKKEKRPRWRGFFHKWQAVAVMIAALGIGTVLIANQLTPMSSSSEEAEQFAANDAAEAGEIETKLHNFDVSDQEAATSQFEGESETADEKKTEVIMMEGMEEEITIKKIEDDELSFSTMIHERYETENEKNAGDYKLRIYANYNGEKRVEPAFFTIAKHEQVSTVAEIKNRLLNQFIKAGYEEQTSEPFFTEHQTELNIVEEMAFASKEETVYIGIVENNGQIYDISVTMISGIEEERIIVDTGVILKYAEIY